MIYLIISWIVVGLLVGGYLALMLDKLIYVRTWRELFTNIFLSIAVIWFGIILGWVGVFLLASVYINYYNLFDKKIPNFLKRLFK